MFERKLRNLWVKVSTISTVTLQDVTYNLWNYRIKKNLIDVLFSLWRHQSSDRLDAVLQAALFFLHLGKLTIIYIPNYLMHAFKYFNYCINPSCNEMEFKGMLIISGDPDPWTSPGYLGKRTLPIAEKCTFCNASNCKWHS